MAIGMIALILLQRGAGATAGASFGGGASGTVFGARGAASFLTKATAVLATGVFGIALAMAVMISRGIGTGQDNNLPFESPVITTDSISPEDVIDAASDVPAPELQTAVPEPIVDTDVPAPVQAQSESASDTEEQSDSE